MLIDTIRQDLTSAMKARDQVKLRSLRAIIAAVQEAEVAGAEAITLDDTGVLKVINSQVKRRVEAVEAYIDGGRAERAADEQAEIEVLQGYLPAALGDDELAAIVDKALTDNEWTTKSHMGQAMKAINTEVKGRADGRKVAELVKSRLA